MATYDISRVAFNPRKHYSSVRMQQGRVLTDDDWNENQRIEEELLRRTNVNIIGRAGSPDNGFKIGPLDLTGGFIDFDIQRGTMYTGGLRLEMDQTERFRLQRDWLQKRDGDYIAPKVSDFPSGETEMFDLVYLEAWRQPVCAIEDSSLFEEALGGPDTTTRLRNTRRVRIFRDTGSDECPLSWKKLRTDWENDGYGKINKEGELVPDTLMKVTFSAEGATDDLCAPSVAGGYLGAENQAIRVQVRSFDGITGKGRFTWGFDNASPLYRVVLSANGDIVTLKTQPKDQYHWALAGQIVEILPWSAALPNNEKMAEQNGFISRVSISYNPDTKSFTLATPVPPGFGTEWKNRADKSDLSMKPDFYFMRIWNRGTDAASAPEIPFDVNNPAKLGNTGLEVTFTGTTFIAPDDETGNFWVIAARPSTPRQLSPWELSTTGIAPHGTRFFYAPLGIIRWTIESGAVVGEVIHDCRKRFHPLTEQECCCTYSVGDGVSSKGDFQSIQEAINNLPADGGKICVLPGIHQGDVNIFNRRKIQIVGCGDHSIVRSPAGSNSPIIRIQNSEQISIINLTLVTFRGIGIDLQDIDGGEASKWITIKENKILACIHAIRIAAIDTPGRYKDDLSTNGNNVRVAYNLIGMYDRDEGDVAIFSLADDVLIERNRIVVIAPPKKDPDDKRPDPPTTDPLDPCATDKKLYERNSRFRDIITASLHYAIAYVASGKKKVFKAPGGIQIACGSEKVWIWQNEIIGGRGNGITLGHFDQLILRERAVNPSSLYEITIQENRIHEMGLCGIGTVLHLLQSAQSASIFVENLAILGNTILYCVHQLDSSETKVILDTEIPYAAISLLFTDDCVIRENRIEDNGNLIRTLISGIYIFYAEKIDVSENRVVNNGPDLRPRGNAVFSPKGGIVIRQALGDLSGKYESAANSTSPKGTATLPSDAIAAAKIHDNIVSQPVGHALFIGAIGPVSVLNNGLTSQGVNETDFFSLFAATVFILDLGISKDLFRITQLMLKNWGHLGNSPLHGKKAIPPLPLQLFPSGKVMFANNQIMLDMRSPEVEFCVSSVIIFSLDDISFNDNQSEMCGVIDPLQTKPNPDKALFNSVLFGISVRAGNNRLTDGLTGGLNDFKYSLLSLALMNTVIGNQSTYCLVAPFFAYRRKALNIQINQVMCVHNPLEDQLNNRNNNFADPEYNYTSF